MTIATLFNQRRIIPRWHESKESIYSGEVIINGKATRTHLENHSTFEKKLNLWENKRIVENAAEVISDALVQGFFYEATEVAKFILNNHEKTTPQVLSIANQILIRSGEIPQVNIFSSSINNLKKQEIYKKINSLKERLNSFPRNPLMWVDLSRLYIIFGQTQKSYDAMMTALILAPNNRFILRSASRLLVHLDKSDQAHDLLFKNENIKNDPWLLAAEIAIASIADIPQKLIRRANSIIEKNLYSNFQIAELSSSLATIELHSGSLKKAKKLFKLSINNPTENSVAQFIWAMREIAGLEINNNQLNKPRAFEAKAINALNNQEWEEVRNASWLWLDDELFSSRPAILGSYASMLGLEDCVSSEEFCRKGLIANPFDSTLNNNLAFALANQGKIIEADLVIQKTIKNKSTENNRIAIMATHGFIEIMKGNIAYGESLYKEAIQIAKNTNLSKYQSLASLYFASTMQKIGKFSYEDAIKFSDEARKQYSDPHIELLFSRIKPIPEKKESLK